MAHGTRTLLDLMDDLPAALRFVRAARRLTLRECAAQVGLSHSALQRIEADKPVKVESVRRVSAWLAGEPS